MKTKIILLFVIFNANILLYPQTFSGGGGLSITDPYLISNVADLQELAAIVNLGYWGVTTPNWSRDKYFKLTQDITDTFRTQIGRAFATSMNGNFEGHFDGDNYKITIGLTHTAGWGAVGLFAYTNYSIILNLIVDGYINSSSPEPAGGIVGAKTNNSLIKNCISYVNITSSGMIGGIVATMSSNSTIESCINAGNLTHIHTGSYYYPVDIGGIAAQSAYGTINFCLNIGDLTSNQTITGGYTSSQGRYIPNHFRIGGIVAFCNNMEITNSINSGYIRSIVINDVAQCFIGGIAGYIMNSIIADCVATGVIEAPDGVNGGGIVGFIQP